MSELGDYFSRSDLAWLVDRIAKRLERGEPADRGTLTLADPTPAQRRAIDDLMGRRSTSGGTLSLDLRRLGDHLGMDEGSLRALVEEVLGAPIVNRRALRVNAAAAWNELHQTMLDHFSGNHSAIGWLDALRADGLLKRLAGDDPAVATVLLKHAAEIIGGIPYDGVLIASLAASTSGDSHALDRGKPLSTLCLRFLVRKYDLSSIATAVERRDAWSAAGVTVDDLSAPALCLNLPAQPGCPPEPWIAWHVERGEPFCLTWRQLAEFSPAWGMGEVFVCENPAIVSEAAARLGTNSRPLICLNGQPSSTVRSLLGKLADANIPLRIRADFDWAGIGILAGLAKRLAFSPWRMSRADYLRCSASVPLGAGPIVSGCMADLATAMNTRGLAAYEEDLIELLIADLRC